MARLKLQMGNTYQDVSINYNEFDTNIMGGCVTVIVHGDNATHAQHCAGGFQALDQYILQGVGTVQIIIIVAHFFSGEDWTRVMAWVQQNKGTGRASYVKSSHALINMDAVRNRNLNNHFLRDL
jgi:hypothetical protein